MMSSQLTSDLTNVAMTSLLVFSVLIGFRWCPRPAFRRTDGA